MVRKHYDFPSLNALAAFEAAGRHMSLTRAAMELNVTPSAMSKQIKLLEQSLGTRLFVRLHRTLELTAEGQTLLTSLRDSFERIAVTLATISKGNRNRSVTVGSTNAFAQLWLMPRLSKFWAEHQSIVVDHLISDRTQDSWLTSVDLRVRYGSGQFEDEGSAKLFSDTILPVASPQFMGGRQCETLGDVAALQLLSVEGADWSWTTWAEFLRAGEIAPRQLAIRRFNSYVIALQAALDGQGVALGWRSLVQPLLKEGRLTAVSRFEMAAPQSFYLTWSLRRPLSEDAATLRDWLLDSCHAPLVS